MTAKFNREAVLTFAGLDSSPVIKDLRITFQIEKHDSPVDNSGVIQIYNLSESLRKELARPYPMQFPLSEPVITVFLKAGYEEESSLIFGGVVIRASNTRIGPDWITEIEAMTATNQILKAGLGDGHSYESTNPLEIVRSLADELKIGKPRIASEAKTILSSAPPETISFTGSAFHALKGFLKKFGLIFTIDDDGLLIALAHKAFDDGAAKSAVPLVSRDTGLIGTPTITRQGINVRMLLNHRIRPMRRFDVESESVEASLVSSGLKAEYTAKKVKHFGDNRSDQWFTEVVGVYATLVPGVLEEASPPAQYI